MTNHNNYSIKSRNKPRAAKFRPTLSSSELLKALELARSESPRTDAGSSLIYRLAPFESKIIESGTYIGPASTLSMKEATSASYGADNLGVGTSASRGTVPLATKEAYWLACYTKYCNDPESCTEQDLAASNEYRYINDLMDPEEIAIFEQGTLNSRELEKQLDQLDSEDSEQSSESSEQLDNSLIKRL